MFVSSIFSYNLFALIQSITNYRQHFGICSWSRLGLIAKWEVYIMHFLKIFLHYNLLHNIYSKTSICSNFYAKFSENIFQVQHSWLKTYLPPNSHISLGSEVGQQSTKLVTYVLFIYLNVCIKYTCKARGVIIQIRPQIFNQLTIILSGLNI